MNKRGTAKAGILYLFASIFNKGIAFLTIPIFTRMLSTEDYGTVTTYSAWASILTAIIGMQLNIGIRLSRGSDCKIKISKHKELSTVFTFTIAIAVIVYSIIVLCSIIFPIDFSFLLISLCFAEGLFTALITDYSYYLMMEYKYLGRTIIMILPNFIAALLSIVLIHYMNKERYMGRIVSLSGIHVVIGLVVCFIVFRFAKPQIDKQYIKWSLRVSLPLILHGVALNILSQADRTMITAIRNTEETGIYSLVYSFSMVATVITTGLEGVWVPWFTRKMNTKDYEHINVIAKDYIHLMTYSIVGLVIISPEFIKVLAPESYWGGMGLIPPLVISNFIIFSYTMYVNVEYYYEKTIFITVNTIIAAATNIVLNAIFIPLFGYSAAAFTTLFSYLVSFVLHARYAKKQNKQVLPFNHFIIPIAHLIAITIVFYVFLEKMIIRWTFLAVYVLVMIIFERKRIGAIFPSIGNKYRFFK